MSELDNKLKWLLDNGYKKVYMGYQFDYQDGGYRAGTRFTYMDIAELSLEALKSFHEHYLNKMRNKEEY